MKHVSGSDEKNRPPEASAGADASRDRALEAKELEGAVGEALSKLSKRERAASIMCQFEGMAYRDIAEALAASEAAVKSLIPRATLSIARALERFQAPADAGIEGREI